MTKDQAKEIAVTMEPEFLAKARVINGRQSYVCPCPDCQNGAGKDGTGITMVPGTEEHKQYHCFKCGFSGDVFSLAKEFYGVSMGEAFQAVYQYFGLSVNNTRAPREFVERAKPKLEEAPSPIEYVDQVDYLKECASRLDPSYLEGRGLSAETQRHYQVGTDPFWKNPLTVERYKSEGKDPSKLKSSPRCIIPTSTRSYLARDTRANLDKTSEKYAKQKYGSTVLFNEERAASQQIVFVTEGEIDAMSVYEASGGAYEAAGLGSTSNWRKVLRSAEDGAMKDALGFVLMLDNDAAGEKAASELKAALEGIGKTVVLAEFKGNDPNEALQTDKEALAASLKDAWEAVAYEEMER